MKFLNKNFISVLLILFVLGLAVNSVSATDNNDILTDMNDGSSDLSYVVETSSSSADEGTVQSFKEADSILPLDPRQEWEPQPSPSNTSKKNDVIWPWDPWDQPWGPGPIMFEESQPGDERPDDEIDPRWPGPWDTQSKHVKFYYS